MKQLQLISETYKIVDGDGKVLLEAPITELYYAIALATEDERLTARQKAEIAAVQLNAEYGTNLGWGQVIVLFNALNDEMENLKKNTTPTLE